MLSGSRVFVFWEVLVVVKYQFSLTGFMPLLMHADDIEGADELKAWRNDASNKNVSVPGDDRSPPWSWQTYLYRSNGSVVMPSENIMASLRVAGAKMILKNKKTFKEASQSGLLITSEHCEFLCNGESVDFSLIDSLRHDSSVTFRDHITYCRDNGFDLDVRRAKVGTNKHIRVRAKFSTWSVSGELVTLVPEFNDGNVSDLFRLAGRAGLCDWRPSAPKSPGPYGQFEAEIVRIK